MEAFAWLVVAWVTAFAISVVPAFMPPMWAVLTAFQITTGAPLFALTIGAAVAGAFGRLVLARGARRASSLLQVSDRTNAEALARWFESRRRWKWPLVVAYCAGPFPSNALFIAAGAGRMGAVPVAVAYAAARAVSDTFWVWTAVQVAEDARGIITGAMTDWRMIVGQVAGAVIVVFVFRLPWARWLGIGRQGRRD